MLVYLCVVILILYHMLICMDVDSLFFCVFSYVRPRGREAELVGELARLGPVRLSWVGEKHRRDEAGARPTYESRVDRRHTFDDPSVGPFHAPQVEADRDL
jgi:hypothetical protein